MLTKRRFFASALLALVLLSAAACAQIDLAPYEIPGIPPWRGSRSFNPVCFSFTTTAR